MLIITSLSRRLLSCLFKFNHVHRPAGSGLLCECDPQWISGPDGPCTLESVPTGGDNFWQLFLLIGAPLLALVLLALLFMRYRVMLKRQVLPPAAMTKYTMIFLCRALTVAACRAARRSETRSRRSPTLCSMRSLRSDPIAGAGFPAPRVHNRLVSD